MNLDLGKAILRTWRITDAPALSKHADNPDIANNLRDRFPQPYTLEAAQGFIAMALAQDPPLLFALEINGEAAGGIGLHIGEDIARKSAEMGYWLAQPYWGSGIVTEAVKAVTAYALRDLGLVRVFAMAYGPNLASKRVLEKAGFRCEGLLKRAVYKNGEILDQWMMAFTDEDAAQQGNG